MLRITKTETGMVKGLPGTDARITVFKGIPYAAPATGKNRWRAPQPAESWEGIRNCFEFAPINMQTTPGKDPDAFYSKEWHVDPEVPMGEDSLALNIWTNAKTGDEKMPVYVWIFGGGLREGYAYEMEFDGERMASRDIVVVTIAYRLNIFGFLSHPDLMAEAPEAPTNFGFLDQQAAMKWVKRNIANFGGDPDNITIGGQSAGGMSVYKHLCAPGSRGLFNRAIAQSSAGGFVGPVYPKPQLPPERDMDFCLEVGKKFLTDTLGVNTIDEARELDAFFIRDKVTETNKYFANTVDNQFVYKYNGDYLFSGEMLDVPLLIGWTGNESLVTAEGDTLEEVKAWANAQFGPYGEEMFQLWRKDAGSDDIDAIKAASTSNSNEIATRFVAEQYTRQGNNIYAYKFDPEMPGDDAGSFHSSDLWFTFETLMKCWRPFQAKHYDMSRKMCNYWVNFIKTGDPNGLDKDGTPMPQWNTYTRETPNVMQFFDDVSVRTDITEYEQRLADINTIALKEQAKA